MNTDPKLINPNRELGKDGVNYYDNSAVNSESTVSASGRPNIPVWEKLRHHTSKFYPMTASVRYWPEPRQQTEAVIRQLLKRRILLISSFDREWSDRAVQRLVSVLFTSKSLENLLVRKVHAKGMLDFGFWVNEPKLPVPVLLIVTMNKDDFLQNFLDQYQSTALDFIRQFEQNNLYIVCQMSDNENIRSLVEKAGDWLYDTYAYWTVPVLRLYLFQEFKQLGAGLFEQTKEKGTSGSDDQELIYHKIRNKSLEEVETIFADLSRYKEESISDTSKKKDSLILLLNEGDQVEQLLIFCGAFFHGLYYPDFLNFVSQLLSGMYLDSTGDQGEGKSAPLIALDTLWRKKVTGYLKKCMLRTVKDNGNHRVEFVTPTLAPLLRDYLINDLYPDFYGHYRKIDDQNYLVNLGISHTLESQIISLFSHAAGMDIDNHDVAWLRNLVIVVWERYKEECPDTNGYRQQQQFIYHQYYKELILSRIPLIIKSLLTGGNNEYQVIIKKFFAELLHTENTRIIAIVLASRLYNDYRYTKTLDSHDLKTELMKYIWHAIEEGDWDDSFFAYDVLLQNFRFDELWLDTDEMIKDAGMSDESWKKRFACLYQLDYTLITFDDYFTKFKGEGNYSLWTELKDQSFPPVFIAFVKQLFSETSVKNLQAILDNEHNTDRLTSMVRQLECAEFGLMLSVSERFEKKWNTTISLLADLVEMWFYLLTGNETIRELEGIVTDLPQVFFNLIRESVALDMLRLMQKYWQTKNEFYTYIINNNRNAKKPANERIERYNLNLVKKRTNLRILFLQLQKSQNIINPK